MQVRMAYPPQSAFRAPWGHEENCGLAHRAATESVDVTVQEDSRACLGARTASGGRVPTKQTQASSGGNHTPLADGTANLPTILSYFLKKCQKGPCASLLGLTVVKYS